MVDRVSQPTSRVDSSSKPHSRITSGGALVNANSLSDPGSERAPPVRTLLQGNMSTDNMQPSKQSTDDGTNDLNRSETNSASGDRLDKLSSTISCVATTDAGFPAQYVTERGLPIASGAEPAAVLDHNKLQHIDADGTVNNEADSLSTEAARTALKIKVPGTPTVQVPKYTANDFKFIKTLGDGSFATVYLAKHIETGRNYAVKVCEKRHIIREKREAYIKRERQVLSMLILHPSPFFVKLFCTFQDTSRLYFVMTYAKNGELLNYIIKVNCFDPVCTKFYTAEVILALEHLHSLGVIHRDIKPENILLNERMHVLITDFGSAAIEGEPSAIDETKRRQSGRSYLRQASVQSEDNINSAADDASGSPQTASDSGTAVTTAAHESDPRTRRRSFVGTADYVPPEMLSDKQSSRSTDLWALGCLVYQLLAGLPPFRAGSDYQIFQKILRLEYTFPEGFDVTAQDLVKTLLVREPSARLGHDLQGGFEELKRHKFYKNIDWDTLHLQTAPVIAPSLATSDFPDRSGSISVAGLAQIEPGLDDRQLTRLMGLSLREDDFALQAGEESLVAETVRSHAPPAQGQPETTPPSSISASHATGHSQQPRMSRTVSRTSTKTSLLDMTDEEKQERLLQQSRTNEWHRFVENNLILKQGFVDKKKGLFPRRRMLLLTTGPHLYYVDPTAMVLKGDIPWSPELRPEAKTFKIFFIHTSNRTYYLIDPSNNAVQWCDAIEDVYAGAYGPRATPPRKQTSSGGSVGTSSGEVSTDSQHQRSGSRGEKAEVI